jgi:hypothetical protein
LTAGKLWCCAHILLSVAALGDLVARFDEVHPSIHSLTQ